ncbi:MAG: hypothetical protein IAE78_00920 [Myxococcus sp.]|nr:hypothetical protein [Myxococcus sp.]
MHRLVLIAPWLALACAPSEPFNPATCPPPTGEQCARHELQDAGPIAPCDQYFINQAKTDPEAACSLLLEQGFRDEVAQWPEKPALPTTLYSGPTKFTPDAGVVTVRHRPDSRTYSPTGLNSKLLGETLRQANGFRFSSTTAALLLRKNMLDKRVAWEANGNSVRECKEYVHEKFYDYTTYLDRLIFNGAFNDPRKAYDIAYDDDANAPRWAIGSRHLQSPVLRSRDGADSGLRIPFQADLPKNDYFRVPEPGSSRITFVKSAVDGDGNPTEADKIDIGPLGEVRIRLQNLKRAALNFRGVEIEDPAVRADLSAGRPFKYQESFAWHRTMNSRNASVLDERLEYFENRKAEFRKLLLRREQLQEALAGATVNPNKIPKTGTNKFATKWWLDGIWNPNPTDVTRAAQRGLDVSAGINQHPGSPFSSPVLTVSNAQSPAPQPVSQSLSIPQVTAACIVAIGQDGSSFNKIICLSYQLAAIDLLIEKELQSARAEGCLELTNPLGPAPCDWSPRSFQQAVSGLFQAEREAAYALCEKSIDSFTLLENKAFNYTSMHSGKSISKPARNYTTSASAIDDYFVVQDEFIAVVADDVGPLLDRTGDNKLRLWVTKGDTHDMGNEYFGAGLLYEAGFAMEDVGANSTCNIKTSTWGKFGVDLRAIGATLELVRADFKAVAGGPATPFTNRFDAELKVLGYTWGIHEEIPMEQTAVFSESEFEYQTFLEQFAIVQVSYVTIRVGAAVGGGMGYGFDFSAGKQTKMGSPCTVDRVGVSGAVTPFAFIQGSAFAVLEAIIARAGIKGYLTLVSVDTPFAGELSLGPNQGDPTIIDATFSMGAKLRLEFFSGRIVLFVEAGICPLCVDAETELVAWRGLVFEIPLFDFDLRLVLGDLKRVFMVQGEVPSQSPAAP